ncbi:unnamed protein product [Linum tenue]|uniref:FLZ-type domain-containing protein n=1 Tax=Linum tenue TaxID=586396 RepID=A0AAV0L3N2_9ROSI|nr:unnamed protein product [Linum tenue]
MMQLGKRPRPAMAMRRTTSMTGITVDVLDPPPLSDSLTNGGSHDINNKTVDQTVDNHYLASMVSPRNSLMNHHNNPHHHLRSVSLESTAHFLRTCGLCQRRLAPSNDIYMYRGDTGFCSLECREEQMKKDARKEKYQQRSKLSAVTNSSGMMNRDDIITIGGGHHPTSSPVPTSTS